MATKEQLKNEIYSRLGCNGYVIDQPNHRTYLAYRSYVLVLSNIEEIQNDGRRFLRTSGAEIDDDLFEDAIGWLNQILPYR